MRRNRHSQMGQSRQRHPARSYQYLHRACYQEQEEQRRKVIPRIEYLENTTTYLTFSSKEKKRPYPHTDQESTWESTWKKERHCQSKKSTHSATTRLKNCISTSNKINREDGFVGSRQDEHHLLCLSRRKTASSGSVWITER